MTGPGDFVQEPPARADKMFMPVAVCAAASASGAGDVDGG